jgi:hypothetical protein
MNTIAAQIAFLKEFTPLIHLNFQELAEIAGNPCLNLEKKNFIPNDIFTIALCCCFRRNSSISYRRC